MLSLFAENAGLIQVPAFVATCFEFVARKARRLPSAASNRPSSPVRACGCCGELDEFHSKGPQGELLCRQCLRAADETLLEPITLAERQGLDLLSDLLDAVPWDFFKPGDQPAKLLDWLYLGDLEEAMDFDLLSKKGIGAVVNLINWWELASRVEINDIASTYASQGIDFLEADSEDRLFFDIVEKSWPQAEDFLRKAHDSGQKVLVNCKAGHNRSANVCVCWLVVHEGMSLLDAVTLVVERRGNVLSNHGFRLQLVRLALRFGRVGTLRKSSKDRIGSWEEDFDRVGSPYQKPSLGNIIMKKRLSIKYDHDSREFLEHGSTATSAKRPSGVLTLPIRRAARKQSNLLFQEDVAEHPTQRSLKMELLAVLYHRKKNFLSDYEYTELPPKIIGSGFSGDVVLCRPLERTAVWQNRETSVRCVKRFNLCAMGPERLEKLKNEASIYLSLEHPHIARLFDVYDDAQEVSLVMQYCSGGTLEASIRQHGRYNEHQFKQVAVQMVLAVAYIHKMGIIHRDIKPRNWVYEADGATVKLIDFGFSAKAYLSNVHGQTSRGVLGCMGTLGYLAPEVVRAGLNLDSAYAEPCDIWSLGAVFFELLAGQPAFYREQGQCDGYTEEVVLREIEEVTQEGVEKLLLQVPLCSRALLRKLLTKDVKVRPTALQVFDDPYLSEARADLERPIVHLPMETVLERFRLQCQLSKTSRAWLLAVARSPTYLPWTDFIKLRNTFKMFDMRNRIGTVNYDAFWAVISDAFCINDDAERAALKADVSCIWDQVCGSQDSLSYCEFLAALLPPIEDVFEDVQPVVRKGGASNRNLSPTLPAGWNIDEDGSPYPSHNSHKRKQMVPPFSPLLRDLVGIMPATRWDPSQPIASYLHLLRVRKRSGNVPIFDDNVSVGQLVQDMYHARFRWVVIRFKSGKHAFFDYMDVNRWLLKTARKQDASKFCTGSAIARISRMPVGALANCSGHSSYVPMTTNTPLREVIEFISQVGGTPGGSRAQDNAMVRRVPIISTDGQTLHIFSCIDFLDLALQFPGPTAALKSLSARAFDQRNTILQASVMNDGPMMNALRTMDSQHLTVCLSTTRELSGDLGGVVASNVVSVSDLKHVFVHNQPDALDMSVKEFVSWRQSVANLKVDKILRKQRLHRFNVVAVGADDSLHTLAVRLLASKLQRIFLSTDETGRIVGCVSSRDILVEVLDQVV